jgi:hypothetical protein
MTVMVTTRIPALPGEAYDGISSQLAGPLRGAEGFVSHVAAVDPDGVTVTELWQAEGDWRQFFETYVEPNLPAEMPAPTIVELRNTILR